jgi:site-specific recombinase XerD
VKKYIQAVTHFLAWWEEQEQQPLTLAALTPITLQQYRQGLQQQQKATQTINLQVNALRSWCAWLVEEGYVAHNPAARFRLVENASVSSRDGLTSTQVNALLEAAHRSRKRLRNIAIVQVLLQTGLRIGECSALRFGDITFGERSGMIEVRAGKGNKARSVPLNASARQAIADYIAPDLGVDDSLKAVAAVWKTVERSKPLWQSQKGGKLTASAIEQMIADLVRDAGPHRVPAGTSAHHLRHTFAHTYLSQHKDDIAGLALLLGHSSLDTTMLYGKPSLSQLAGRVESLTSNAYI